MRPIFCATRVRPLWKEHTYSFQDLSRPFSRASYIKKNTRVVLHFERSALLSKLSKCSIVFKTPSLCLNFFASKRALSNHTTSWGTKYVKTKVALECEHRKVTLYCARHRCVFSHGSIIWSIPTCDGYGGAVSWKKTRFSKKEKSKNLIGRHLFASSFSVL